ncbi:MAG: hypothetical protein AAGF54_05120 [Pseudomonadota bacterium]
MTNEYTYIDNLIEDCKTAKRVTHKEMIESPGDITAFNGVKNAIYVIEEVGGNPDETFKKFLEFKAKKLRPCPEENHAGPILYVGSSVGSLEGRLKQHIGRNNNRSTSALNLSHWFKGEFRIIAKTYDVSPDVLQIIEDSLHFHLKPAFGKKGGNSK